MNNPDLRRTPGRTENVGFPVPQESWDCHVHIFNRRYPYVSKRKYTPANALPADLSAMLDRAGISRALIVQASPYGTDNRCTLDTVHGGDGRYLAVAVIGLDIEAGAIADLHRRGIRGIRLNFAGLAAVDTFHAHLRHLGQLAPQLIAHGWHVETHLPPKLLEEVIRDEALRDVPVVADHFGLGGVPPEEFDDALKWIGQTLETGRLWIKLSAPYRLGKGEVGFDQAAWATGVYLARNPERLVWASDWPHTPPHPKVAAVEQVVPFRDIDPMDLLRFLGQTVTRREHRERILSENPKHLLCGA